MSGSNGIPKLTFDEYDLEDLKLSPCELDLIRRTGILQIKDFRIGSRKSLSAKFLHSTMQEMLAAVHIFLNPVASKGTLKRRFIDVQFNNVLMYLFGLQYDEDSNWIKEVCRAVNPSEVCAENYVDLHLYGFVTQLSIFAAKGITSDRGSANKLNVCQLIHEGHVEDLAKCVVDYIVPNDRLKVMHTPMTAIDLIAVTFVCQYSHTLTHITVSGINADDTFMKHLSSSIIMPNVNSLQFLNLRKNNIRAEGTEVLAKIVQQSGCLNTLTLSENHIGDKGAKILAEALHTNNNLQVLDVSDNDIGEDGAKALAKVLHTNNSLQSLVVSDSAIGEVGTKALVDVLYTQASLYQLVISGETVCAPTKAMYKALSTNNSKLVTEDHQNHLTKEEQLTKQEHLTVQSYRWVLFSIAVGSLDVVLIWPLLAMSLYDYSVFVWCSVGFFTWLVYVVYITDTAGLLNFKLFWKDSLLVVCFLAVVSAAFFAGLAGLYSTFPDALHALKEYYISLLDAPYLNI